MIKQVKFEEFPFFKSPEVIGMVFTSIYVYMTVCDRMNM